MSNTTKNHTMRNWMLGVTLIGGMLGAGAASANAAPREFPGHGGFAGRSITPISAYRPACPGAGYIWNEGYYNGPYWVPGAWVFGGHDFYRGYGYRGFERDRRFDNRVARFEDRRGYRGFERGDGRGFEGGQGRGFRGRR